MRSVDYDYKSDVGTYSVNASLDDEFGWRACISFSSFGERTPEDAVRALVELAAKFQKDMENLGTVEAAGVLE